MSRERIAEAFKFHADMVAEAAFISDYDPKKALASFMADDRILALTAAAPERIAGLGPMFRRLDEIADGDGFATLTLSPTTAKAVRNYLSAPQRETDHE